MKFHPAALIPPPLTDEDYAALKSDIAAHGLLHPIRTLDGMILDGRHRYRACTELNVEPRFEQYIGPLAPLAYVISNTRHRHMTPGQKAVMALDIERYEAEEARLRQEASRFSAVVERIPPPETPAGKARDKAAAAVGVNPRYVSDAKKLERESPELLARVKSGSLSLPAAKAQARDDANRADLQRAVTFDLPAGLHVGDFREKASFLADECAELVFTDPPYESKVSS